LHFEADIDGKLRQVLVRRTNGRFVVDVDGRSFVVDARRVGDRTLSLLLSPASGGE